jgi:hypothetical protein
MNHEGPAVPTHKAHEDTVPACLLQCLFRGYSGPENPN